MTARGELPFVLIGNPENRRITLFQQALAELGRPQATVVPWLALAQGPEALAAIPLAEAILRIDSAGESFEVDRAFLRLGFEAAVEAGASTIDPAKIAALVPDRGRITCPRQLHLGFLRVVDTLAPVLADKPGWRVLTPLREIEVLFDKRVTSRRYRALGLPVPEPLDGVTDPDTLAAEMDRRRIHSVYVKLSCSSSASCLAIYTRRPTDRRESLTTTIEQASTGWYNSLRLRRIERRENVDEILRFLIDNGSQIEAAIPKARLDGAFFDCRVVVIDAAPEFVVVRQNHHPITNLHLGGWRGALAALEREAGPALSQGLSSCRRAAESHGCFSLGVDLMFERGFTGHRILESNAFGDLLPNLTKDGKSVYGMQIERALQRF